MKVIAKLEGTPGNQNVALFFPEIKVTPGCIFCWAAIGEHSEASMGYFWSLRSPDEDEAKKTIAAYEKRYGVVCQRAQRDSYPMRMARWEPSAVVNL